MYKFIAIWVAAALLTACTGAGTNTTPPISQQSVTQQQSSSQLSSTQENTFPQTTASSTNGFADGLAYAAKVTVNGTSGITAIAGPIARATLPCLSTVNTAENSVATLSVAPYVVSSGTADDVVTRSYTATGGSVTATSTIQGVGVLGGLITATTVKAQANSQGNNGTATSNGNGSQFVGLVVAGQPITVNPAPNTKINLANLGYVILNEQTATGNGTQTSTMTVNMIHVVVTTANTLNIPVNTNIIVASAHSAYTIPPAPFALHAQAYSLYATGLAANVGATSGPWAIATLPCDGDSNTDRLVSATTPVGSLGTMVNKVSATQTATTSSVNASSSTASLNLLGGLITGQTVVTMVQVNRNGTAITHTGSMTFVALSIAGQPISAGVAPNTKITLPGLGYVIVNEQNGTADSFQVNALHIHVTTSNSLGLPVGADIIVGHSSARINPL